jgi:hypothetical protein
VAQALHHSDADVLERHSGKLCVQIVRRLSQSLRIDLFADFDGFPGDLPAVGYDDDEDFCGAERDELDFLQDAVAGRDGQGKCNQPRGAGQHERHRGEHVFS